jgi:glycosyltransferase involved in cell wall biosynthesis
MACGLACVAPASAGGQDLLMDGAGVIPPSNSAEDLEAAITPLIRDADLRARLGVAAATRVQAQQLGAVVDAYERLYGVIQHKRHR